mmetsp:Transcript_54629/g.144346  ORF Transcript_54629/g.144346 Transcript_54629/m.144346 type:complete len:392 (+) Transcript_54629:3-1178(+)
MEMMVAQVEGPKVASCPPTSSAEAGDKCSKSVLHKIVLAGDSGVGKSCLLSQFVDGSFTEHFNQTIGVEFSSRHISVDGRTVKLQIWDTAGHESFRSLIRSYLRGAHGIVLVYDVTNQESFKNLGQWIQDIRADETSNVRFLLVGNKCDLASRKVVDTARAQAYADQLGIPFLEASAKSSDNVEEAMEMMVAQVEGPKVASCPPTSSAEAGDKCSKSVLHKIVLAGDSGVGKSCLLSQFVDGSFTEHFNQTIGVEFSSRHISVDGRTVKLQIWDTAGHESFRSLIRSYLRGAHGIVLVYDVTNQESFKNLGQWIQDIRADETSNVVPTDCVSICNAHSMCRCDSCLLATSAIWRAERSWTRRERRRTPISWAFRFSKRRRKALTTWRRRWR